MNNPSWFNRIAQNISIGNTKKSIVPEGMWTKCTKCEAVLNTEKLHQNLKVCMQCHHHFPLTAPERLSMTFDEGNYVSLYLDVQPNDPLKFKDTKPYKTRIQHAQANDKSAESLQVGEGTILGKQVICAAFDFTFMGGSMGSVAGERFVRAAKASAHTHLPFVCFAASGGARMQESLFSLLQMARTAQAIMELREKSIPYICVLTDPTYGGVTASLAMLGDIHIAEPSARIGFAGARVIKQTVREELPKGFQSSEFLLEHGFVDRIVERTSLRQELFDCLDILSFAH